MGQKGRTGLEKIVNKNVYDNLNKEILAKMLREVLRDYRDSHFNLKEGELANIKYNSTQTLAQYLSNFIGRTPLVGTLLNLDIGGGQNNDQINVKQGDDNIIVNASFIKGASNSNEIEIVLNDSYIGREVIPVVLTYSPLLEAQTNLLTPVIRRVNTTESNKKIRLAIREAYNQLQDINIQIIIL